MLFRKGEKREKSLKGDVFRVIGRGGKKGRGLGGKGERSGKGLLDLGEGGSFLR